MNEKLEIPALRENFAVVTSFVGNLLEEKNCDIKLRLLMETIVEEIFVNIASYAYPEGTGCAVIEFSCENDIAKITFTDQGVPFDPLAHVDPDVKASIAERNIGGMGIIMIKKMMDKVTYRSENGCNTLTIQKKIR